MLDPSDSYDCMFAFNYRRVTSGTYSFLQSDVSIACVIIFYQLLKYKRNSC